MDAHPGHVRTDGAIPGSFDPADVNMRRPEHETTHAPSDPEAITREADGPSRRSRRDSGEGASALEGSAPQPLRGGGAIRHDGTTGHRHGMPRQARANHVN